MIQIDRLHIRRALQFTDLSLALPQGITAVTGGNGSGKSSLLRLLAYAMTGQVDGSWGSQSDLQQDGALLPGEVFLSMHDSKHSYVVRRGILDNAKQPDTLEVDGKQEASKRGAVNNRLSELFGCSTTVLFRLMWGRQEEMEWLLCSSPTVVAAFFSDIFDMSPLERTRKALTEMLQSVCDIPDATEALKEHLGFLETNKKSREDVDKQLKELDAKQEAAELELAQLRSKYTANALSQCDFDTAKARYRAKMAALEAKAKPVEAFKNPEHVELRIKELQASRERLEAHYNEAKAETAVCMDNRNRCQSAQSRMASFMQLLKEPPKLCPLCGQAMEDKEHFLEEKAKELTSGEGSVQWLRENGDSMLKQLTDNLSAAEAAYTKASDIEPRIEQELRICDEMLAAAWKDYREGIQKSKDALNATVAAKQLEALKAEFEKYTAVHDIISDEDAIRIQQLELSYDTVRNPLIVEKAKLEVRHNMLRQQVQKLKESQIQRSRNDKFAGVLQVLRQAAGMPTKLRFLDSTAKLLNRQIQLLAEAAGIALFPQLDANTMSFNYLTPDRHQHRTGHLSGAQKKLAAMLLQLAMMRQVCPVMPLQMLDEVDASLDPGNRLLLTDMLSGLRGNLAGSLLIVTREEETINQCNAVIDVEAERSKSNQDD